MAELVAFEKKGPVLLQMPKRQETNQEEVARRFTDQLDNIENFVIMAHGKDGSMGLFTCLDGDIPAWQFIEAFKARTVEAMIIRLGKPQQAPPPTVG